MYFLFSRTAHFLIRRLCPLVSGLQNCNTFSNLWLKMTYLLELVSILGDSM